MSRPSADTLRISLTGQLFITLFVVLCLAACDQKKKLLTQTSWIITGVKTNDKAASNRGFVRFTNEYEDYRLSLYEDGKARLPGINSPTLEGSWEITDDQIIFKVDTSMIRYYFRYPGADLSFLNSDSAKVQDTITMQDAITVHAQDTTTTDEAGGMTLGSVGWSLEDLIAFKKAKVFYEQPFSFRVSRDTLLLITKQVTLRAEPQVRIVNLLEEEMNDN